MYCCRRRVIGGRKRACRDLVCLQNLQSNSYPPLDTPERLLFPIFHRHLIQHQTTPPRPAHSHLLIPPLARPRPTPIPPTRPHTPPLLQRPERTLPLFPLSIPLPKSLPLAPLRSLIVGNKVVRDAPAEIGLKAQQEENENQHDQDPEGEEEEENRFFGVHVALFLVAHGFVEVEVGRWVVEGMVR